MTSRPNIVIAARLSKLSNSQCVTIPQPQVEKKFIFVKLAFLFPLFQFIMLSLKSSRSVFSTFQFKRCFSLDVKCLTILWTFFPLDNNVYISKIQGRNRLSSQFVPLTKDKNADNTNTSTSHAILLKGGFVRQVKFYRVECTNCRVNVNKLSFARVVQAFILFYHWV